MQRNPRPDDPPPPPEPSLPSSDEAEDDDELTDRAKRAMRRSKTTLSRAMAPGGKKRAAGDGVPPDSLQVAAWLRNIDETNVDEPEDDPAPLREIMQMTETVRIVKSLQLISNGKAQPYPFLPQKLALARKLADDIAGVEGEEITTRAQGHITELEALLYSRAGTKPRPARETTATEKDIADTDLTNMSGKQLAHTAASK